MARDPSSPAKAGDVNPFAGALSLVVEPRLSSATRWYVTADPAEIDGLEYAYLAGGEGPQVESKSGWDVDGVEITGDSGLRRRLHRPPRLVRQCGCLMVDLAELIPLAGRPDGSPLPGCAHRRV